MHFMPVTPEGRQLTGQTRSGGLGGGLLRGYCSSADLFSPTKLISADANP